jgi:hypothetical protein
MRFQRHKGAQISFMRPVRPPMEHIDVQRR